MAIVDGGQVVEKMEFPVGGIFSLLPWQEIGTGLRRIQGCLKEMGSSLDKPIFALNFLPFVTLPVRRSSQGMSARSSAVLLTYLAQ